MTNITETKHIVAGDFWGFLEEYDKAIAQGFQRNPRNEYFPQAYLNTYTITLVKEEETMQEPVVEVVKAPTLAKTMAERFPDQKGAAAKRGRQASN